MIFNSRYTMLLAVMLCISSLSSCTNDSEGSTSCDISDYKTKRIGNRVWMVENLNCDAAGSKCYDNDPANCKRYGRLYNWKTAISVCPSGWHLSSDADWDELINYVESKGECEGCAGRYLKAIDGWNEDGNGEDTHGFSALPGGIGSSNGSFRDVGDYGVWWSSSECYDYNAYGRLMYYAYDYAYYDVGDKSILLSVRCVKDIWNP
ncbi:MAG: hypothetical protein FWF63_01740 [Fibromonadales bacterium]|nr:hypothetical protein [Fibromonadales bacterium]